MALKSKATRRLFTATLHIRCYSAPAERSIPAAKQKYVPNSGTYPQGFLAGSSHAGVKKSNTSYDDIALIVSEQPCPAAAVFTRNLFKAAPVTVSHQILAQRHSDGLRGVVINSGCANAVTGTVGIDMAREMGRAADRCFAPEAAPEAASKPSEPEDSPQESTPAQIPMRTLVMSTGVIGQRLPIDRINGAIPKAHAALGASHEHWMRAAQAICTTDTFPKLLSRTFTLPSHPETEYSIAGMTKGAGMIHPNMGTLLAIICTDVKIAPNSMTPLLRYSIDRTFNSISIDGDTSTNDTVAFFANGAAAPADMESLSLPERDMAQRKSLSSQMSQDVRAFSNVLRAFMADLAQLVVRDGEGATKFVTIRVHSDHNFGSARRVAMSIATSSLVKTALYGKDANWGRILCAIGYAPGVMYDPFLPLSGSGGNSKAAKELNGQVQASRTSVSFVPSDGSEELKLVVRGEPEEVDEERAKAILEMGDLEILVKLNDDGPERPVSEQTSKGKPGKASEAVVWTCDFSHEYVTINGDYRT